MEGEGVKYEWTELPVELSLSSLIGFFKRTLSAVFLSSSELWCIDFCLWLLAWYLTSIRLAALAIWSEYYGKRYSNLQVYSYSMTHYRFSLHLNVNAWCSCLNTSSSWMCLKIIYCKSCDITFSSVLDSLYEDFEHLAFVFVLVLQDNKYILAYLLSQLFILWRFIFLYGHGINIFFLNCDWTAGYQQLKTLTTLIGASGCWCVQLFKLFFTILKGPVCKV